MTSNRVKKRTRRRMAETGENYTRALRAVLNSRANAQPLAGMPSATRGAGPKTAATSAGQTANTSTGISATTETMENRADRVEETPAAQLDRQPGYAGSRAGRPARPES